MAVTVQHVGVAILLAIAASITALSVLGVVISRSTFVKLHYVAPAAIVSPILVTAAVIWWEEALNARALQLVLLVVAASFLQPVLSHATARAERMRRFGDWHAQEHEKAGS